ncbi:MAG: MaoC family dehydratase N-terminal domain-containing protein [Chloroflexota bacterium]|nr:MaoC family dehydratase N-terminal domain-containing protein [Chloroflexota bacterium]
MAEKKDWSQHPRVTVSARDKLPEHTQITPEMIERRRSRSNKPFYPGGVYYNKQASRDAVIHFTNGIGDTNPLFRSEEYAKKSKYHGVIAPGSFLYTVMWVVPGGGMPGVHAWYSGGDWEWYRPVYADDLFTPIGVLRDIDIKKGRMAGGGDIYIDYDEGIYVNQRGEIVGKELHHTVWADRGSSGSAGKYRAIERPKYSSEEWLKFLEMYDNEELRGAEPRWWENVQEGDQVGPMIKGPLTVRDEIAWLMGAGSPFFRAHKIEFEFERRHPRALEYVEEMDEADVPELVHIFDAYARAIGVERAYDYGSQRMSWLCNLFTNWMGDDAFLWKMSGDERAFNQMGDVTTFEGRVVKKYIDDGKCCVDIEAWAKNQRDEWSMPPRTSTVILPSKEHGPVVYPNPPQALVEEVSQARPLDEVRDR